MLRHIPKNISPELMKALLEMGHGDEIVFADANFPAHSVGHRVIHADGDTITALLESILPFFPLDHFESQNVFLMQVVSGKGEPPKVWGRYEQLLRKYDAEKAFIQFSLLERQAFYERAKRAYVVVATGEKEKYSNLILKLGVVEQ
jgi:L-fucose mutarotase